MNNKEMKKVLIDLNAGWGLDFVSETMGNCCWSCASFKTQDEEERFEEADTYLVIKWYYKGVNYDGDFNEQDHLYINYQLGDLVSVDDVCNDLEERLKGRYQVKKPKDDKDCIELIKH